MTMPSLNLRISASHLVSSCATSRWYSWNRRTSSSVGPKPCSWAMRRFSFNSVMNGIASTPTRLNRSMAAASRWRPSGKFVQSLGDLDQDFGGGLHLASGGVQVDAHALQGGPRLFSFPRILVRRLGEAAHQPLHDRDVLADGLRGEAELPDLLGGQAGAQLRVLHPRAIFAQALGRLKCRNTEASQCGRARHDAHAERPHAGKQGANGAFRPLNGILDELANAISE